MFKPILTLIFILGVCSGAFLPSFNAMAKPEIVTVQSRPAIVSKQDRAAIREYIQAYDAQHRENTHTVGWGFAYADDVDSMVSSFGVKNLKSRETGSKELKSNEPVTGDTVFRIASVSKVFVAIAVQRLVQENVVDLDVDIALYLQDFPGLSQLKYPITLRLLLTHTAGFEDKFYGDSARVEADTETLETHLSKALPLQVHEPGTLIRYSNYGSALAALVVEQVSKMPFHQYVQEFILKPSGMVNSGYMLTETLDRKIATGYRFKDGEYQQRPYTWVHRYPPTSMLTTANDMAKFIKMLVSGGQGEQGRVLSPRSVTQMFSTHFTHDKDIPGMALGWMEFQRYGNKTLYHDGGTPGFAAELVIIPEQNAGYFIVTNQKNSSLPGDLRYDFLKHFFDNSDPQTEEYAVIEPSLPLNDYSGSYQTTRRNHTSFEKFALLMSREIEVSVSKTTVPKASISKSTGSNETQNLWYWNREYIPYAPHKFVHQESGHKLVFKVNNGNVTHLTLDWGGAPRAYKKVDLLEQRNVQMLILGTIVICSFLVLIIAMVRQVKYGNKAHSEILANSLFLIFIFGLVIFAITLDSVLIRLNEITALKLLLALPVLALFTIIVQFIQKKWQWSRLLAISPVVAGLVWLNQYNLLGWWFY